MMDLTTKSPKEPTEEQLKKKLEEAEKQRLRRISAMERFARTLSADDFAGISSQSEKIQYTHIHKARKRKGGSPPRDYYGVEILIDFRQALEQQNYVEALTLYYQIRRMLGYYNW
jgi:hypothetical protein